MQNKYKTNISELPERLRQLHTPPKYLYQQGSELSKLLQRPTVGIVGSRKVSSYGRSVTEDFANTLAKQGIVIVSGLALGVDSIAHRACLEAKGQTIAVLPSGLEAIYPSSHQGLAKQIIQTGGSLVTEYEPQEKPMKHFFIARNRIIAALSDILLVTEAAERSGSLHTANFALELGKPVFAVPGNITNINSSGTNKLIQMGASPALSPEDLIQELGLASAPIAAYIPENEAEELLLTLLDQGISDGELLHQKSGLASQVYQQHLTLLEIKGVIKPLSANRWQKL